MITHFRFLPGVFGNGPITAEDINSANLPWMFHPYAGVNICIPDAAAVALAKLPVERIPCLPTLKIRWMKLNPVRAQGIPAIGLTHPTDELKTVMFGIAVTINTELEIDMP